MKETTLESLKLSHGFHVLSAVGAGVALRRVPPQEPLLEGRARLQGGPTEFYPINLQQKVEHTLKSTYVIVYGLMFNIF